MVSVIVFIDLFSPLLLEIASIHYLRKLSFNFQELATEEKHFSSDSNNFLIFFM
jgi:hypothetical protein